MNTKLPPLPIKEYQDRLNYDPSTGDLTWKETRGRYARAGELAGTITKRGDVVVTVLGRKISALAIAWALGRGQWPNRPLYVLDGDKENLKLLNIAPRERAGVVSVATAQVYEHRDTREKKRIDPDQYPNIAWSDQRRKWVVYDSTEIVGMLQLRHKRERGTYDDADEAIDRSLEIETLAQIAYTFRPDPGLAFAYALTPSGISYSDLAANLAYDPLTGFFVWTSGAVKGDRADVPEFRAPTSKRYVAYSSTRLWAHLLAWFYTTGKWPPRKRFAPIDGDYSNTAVTNLTLI